MANSDKKIGIFPETGTSGYPRIEFAGSGNIPITIETLDDNSLNFKSSLNSSILRIYPSGTISVTSGNFTNSLQVNGTGVSLSGHTHSSSDITNFNSSVSGLLPTGTANYIPKFGTGGSGLSNSLIFDNGTGVAIGTTTPNANLTVYSTIYGAPNSGNRGAFNIAFGNTNGLSLGTYSTAPYSNYIQSMGTAGTTYPLALNPIGGNVGINTVDPSGKFHIESAVANNSYILLSNPGNVIKTHIGVGNSDSVPFLASINNIQLASGIYGWGFFDRNTEGNLNIQRRGGDTPWVSVMTASRSNGNVGIGTGVQATTPPEKLTVDGNIRVADTSVTQGNVIQFNRGGGTQYDYSIGRYGNLSLAISLAADASSQRPLQVGYHSGVTFLPKFHINGYTGDVGMGTVSPASKLHVAGNVSIGSGYNVSTPTNGLIVQGNVGIGTASPQSKVHITDTNDLNTTIEYTNATSGFASGVRPLKLLLTGSNGVGVGAGVGIDFVTKSSSTEYTGARIVSNRTDTSNNHALTFWAGGGTTSLSEYMRISSNGNVGIGISSPSHKLHVSGVIRSTSYITSDTEFRLNNATFSRVATMDSAGAFAGGYNVYLSGSTPKHNSAGAISSYYYHSDGTIRFYTNSSQSADTDASERLRISSAGNVGIGTTSPESSLTINTTIGSSSNINSTAGYAFGIHHSGMRITSPEDTSTNPNYPLINLLVSRPGGHQGGTASIDFDSRDRGNAINRGIMARILGGNMYNTAANTSGGGYLSLEVAPTGSTTPISRIAIINNGNVGIGIGNPVEKLEIDGSLKFFNCTTRILRADNNSLKFAATSSAMGYYGIYIDNTATAGGRNFRLASWADGTTGKFIIRDDTSGADRLAIDANGYVGIGMNNPSERIHVSGAQTTIRLNNSLSYDTQLRLTDTASDWSVGINQGNTLGSGVFSIRSFTAGASRLVINTNGNVGIGTETPSDKLNVIGNISAGTISNTKGNFIAYGSAGQPNLLFEGFGSDGTARISTNSGSNRQLKIENDGASTTLGVYIEGDVGIGTTTPTYKLQVNGSFAASTKSFRIDHPSKSGWNLEYGSLESPYHGVRLTGRGTVIKGVGTVSLPVYLKDLIHDDDTLNIQITNIKHGKTIYIDKIDLQNDQFIVKADRAKSLGELEFFWTLSGVRKDVDHLVVEKEN